MITIYVDADAMPRDAMASIQRLGDQYSATVITVSSINHEIQSAHHITVDPDPQATDMKIVGLVQRDLPTVVVTQDYGLAALVLGKGAIVLSPSGFEYTHENIDRLLMERALHAHERRATGRSKGPKARTLENRQSFAAALERALKEMVEASQS